MRTQTLTLSISSFFLSGLLMLGCSMTFQTIIASVPVTKGKKKWVVIGPATNSAIIRVVLNQNPDVYGIMPAPFIIQP